MPAKSKAQQRFMGMVHAYKKGELKGSEVSKAIKKAAKGMKKKTAKDYASTKHTDKPERVKSEAKERDYKAEYKKFQSSTKSKKYRAELNKYNRQKGTYGNGDGKDASHKGGKIAGFEKESTNRGRREKSRLKKETVNEAGLEMNKLKDAIKMFQKKIKKQGRVTNARDEEHLKNLIKVYKQMGGKGVKEAVIKVSKKDDIPGNPMKMKGEEKIKKLAWSGSVGMKKPGSYEIKGNKLNVNNIRPRDKGFFVRHFTMGTGFRKANLYYDGVHWQGKKKF